MKIYNPCPKKENKLDWAVTTKERKSAVTPGVTVKAVDTNTGIEIACGSLVSITNDGKVILHPGVNPKLGLGTKLRVIPG